MPRTVHITVPPEHRSDLLERIERIDGVFTLVAHPGASRLPPGDLVVVCGTNQAAEQATRIAADRGLLADGALILTEPVGLASRERRRKIEDDTSESTWEEMDTLLRRDANPSHNFLAMMVLAGAVAGAGLMLDTLHIIIGAMLIAPGFEPLVRIAVGLAAGLPDTARRGVVGTLVAYAMLAAGAAAGMYVVAWLDPSVQVDKLSGQGWVQYWSSFKWSGVAIGVLAGLAGAIVVNAHQTVFATGVMIALALIPAMAIAGMGLAAGEPDLALRGLGRWAVEVACVIGASLAVFAVKRLILRRPGLT